MEDKETLSNFYDRAIRLYKKTKQQAIINMQGSYRDHSALGVCYLQTTVRGGGGRKRYRKC